MNRFALVLTAVMAAPVAAFAADTDSHTVTVTVTAINEVDVSAGTVALSITGSSAGGDPTPATDSSATLVWTTNESNKKITAQTSLAVVQFPLSVEATNTTGGTASAAVVLSTTAQDLVTAISLTSGGCDLSYTATATAAAGTGLDTHTVTYTITDTI